MLLIAHKLLPIKVNIPHLFKFKKKRKTLYVVRSEIAI